MKKILMILLLMFSLSIMNSCNNGTVEVVSVSVETQTVPAEILVSELDDKLDDIKLKVSKSDDSVEYVNVSKDMLTADDYIKLKKEGTYTIVITYLDYKVSVTLTIKEAGNEDIGGNEEVQNEWEYKLSLPSTEALTEATNPGVIEGAPDLMIIGAVLDTYQYYHYATMSSYEYLKIYNNTNSEYNLKNHRIVLANPIQGQNLENTDSKKGNEVLCTGFLFMGLIDEDFIIPANSIGLVWLHPYYWTCASGSNGYNGIFSATPVHVGYEQKGAMDQTLDDFKDFWGMQESSVPVYKLTNMAIAGRMTLTGDNKTEMYPVISPGSGTPFTHLNSTLIRSLEIQKFNDQSGTAEINLLNKYSDLPADKQKNPDLLYGRRVFNLMEIKDNNEVVDGYYYENTWKYWDPVCRINFCGKVNTSTLDPGQTTVSFNNTSNPGICGIEANVELQFRPPLPGEKIMQWQLPLREINKYKNYMGSTEYSVMRFSKDNVLDLEYVTKTIKLSVDPNGELGINWKTDEIYSEGRMSCAAPTKIHLINLTAPTSD